MSRDFFIDAFDVGIVQELLVQIAILA